MPAPTTAPLGPWPTEREADANDSDCGSGRPCGGEDCPPSDPPVPDPGVGESAEPVRPSGSSTVVPVEEGGAAAKAGEDVGEGLAAGWRTDRGPGTGGGTGAGDEDSAGLVKAAEPEVGSGAWAGDAVSALRLGPSSEPTRLMATPLAISTTRADANASPTNAPRRCCSTKRVLPQTPQSDRPGDANSRPSGR